MKEAIKEELENVHDYNENEHIINMWEPLEFNIDEKYQYVPKGRLFNICSYLLYYGIAVPILYVLTKIMYDLKIEGRENLQSLKTGSISVSNHVLVLDCAMIRIGIR